MLTTLLAGFLTLVSVTSSFANSFALSEASLDWSNFTVTTTGSLVLTRVDTAGHTAFSQALSTPFGHIPSGGPFTTEIHDNDDHGSTQTSVAFSHAFEAGIASTNNGVLHAMSQAGATLESANMHHVASVAGTSMNAWYYGSGIGELAVSVPYHLSLTLQETQSRSVPGLDDLTSGAAGAFLFIGPPRGGTSQSASLAWPSTNQPLNSTLTEDGILRASVTFTNPTWGPLVGFLAYSKTDAIAATVPEPSTWLLLVVGLLAACVIGRRLSARI